MSTVNPLGGLLIDFWQDLQQPDVLWQIAVLGLCFGLAWLASHFIGKLSANAGCDGSDCRW
jgi:hypothetical protein